MARVTDQSVGAEQHLVPTEPRRRTRVSAARIKARSRVTLTAPPNQRRLATLIAIASRTTPPTTRTRSSSACTCPSVTVPACDEVLMHPLPCRARALLPLCTVRSSSPKAATIACTGQPICEQRDDGDDEGMRVVDAIERRVPVVALKVFPHRLQR